MGLGDDLAKNPDDALDPDIAYKVMSYGMREGFGHGFDSLSHYINATRCDYLGARRIVFFSVHDCAAFIQGYAEDLEMLLRVSCNTSFSDSPYRGFERDDAETIARVRQTMQMVGPYARYGPYAKWARGSTDGPKRHVPVLRP